MPARRSPGNGRSGSEPDDVPFEELPPLPPSMTHHKPSSTINKPPPGIQSSISPSSSSLSTSCSNGSNRINNNSTSSSNGGYACIQKNRIKASNNKRLNNNRNNTDCDTSSEQEVAWKGSKPVPPPSVAQMKPPPKPVHGNVLSNGNLDKCPPVSLQDNSTSPCQTENQVWPLTRYFFLFLAGKKIIYYLACRGGNDPSLRTI